MIFRFRDRSLDLKSRVAVMGILNVTPDSFSEAGRNFEAATAISAGLQMQAQGANIIDIGGESTRPGAEPVTAQEEIRRVIPVIEGLRRQTDIPISIDTYKSEVARLALDGGVDIVNDISGFQRDQSMGRVAMEYGAGCIVMHMRGTPQTMQHNTEYDDLIGEVSDYFESRLHVLLELGIDRERTCIDPGIGFSKTAEQNLTLINRLDQFLRFGRPILIGVSRKSFIGNILNIPEPRHRLWGTAAAVSYAIGRGARIIRVHDVAEMSDVCAIANAIARS